MPSRCSDPRNAGLTFFSRVSAAVSHELKNVLAIINENAGLLDDLVVMSEKGTRLSPERLRRLAETLHTQTRRADEIVKNMNRFAHSADHPADVVDLYDAAVFITGLCNRMLRSKALVVTVVPPDSPVKIETDLFHQQALIFACIETIVKKASAACAIRIEFRRLDPGAEIRFACGSCARNVSFARVMTNEIKSLLALLKAEPAGETGSDSFGVRFPGSIGKGCEGS